MGGYYQNSYKAVMKDLQGRRHYAESRRKRWLKAHGEVGCYLDLVLVVQFLDKLIEAAKESYALEKQKRKAERQEQPEQVMLDLGNETA